jgi:hypothetical protein
MAFKPEKVCTKHVILRPVGIAKHKRATNRKERRDAKRDPENAPKKRAYAGETC